MARRLFGSDNPAGVALDPKTGKLRTTPGICAGMTAVWCLKMSLGMAPENTQPGKTEALHLQYSYDGLATSMKGLLTEFLPMARLSFRDNIHKGKGRPTAAGVIATAADSAFFWGYPGHAIGAGKRGDVYYVFDPDRGLDELNGKREFTRHLEDTYPRQLDLDDWLLIEVEPDARQIDLIRPPRVD